MIIRTRIVLSQYIDAIDFLHYYYLTVWSLNRDSVCGGKSVFYIYFQISLSASMMDPLDLKSVSICAEVVEERLHGHWMSPHTQE